MIPRLFLSLLFLLALFPRMALAEFKAGAAIVDVTPEMLPVLVNGGMLSRSIDKIKTRVHARAVAVSDGRETLALVVVDSCMMTRPFLDEVKALAEKQTGIPAARMLISATHTHTAPASMSCLGTDADPVYVPFLRGKIVEAIAGAQAALQPARVGFARKDAADFTAVRRWIRRPDRIAEDPFGNMTVRANMHAGRNWDDVTGESGPEDPALSLISFQTRDGHPLAVIANFSMHYFGDQSISADYFGLFAEGLKQRLAPAPAKGQPEFVGMMSHGCSGDIYRVDYTVPEKDRPKPTIGDFSTGLLDIAMSAYQGIRYRDDADIKMAERRMTLHYRVPDRQRLEWAERVVAGMEDRLAKTPTEVYAKEQLILSERKKTEVVVQALRLGQIAIATTPCETYAVTGLKIKAASPIADTMVIELANGGDGYIPPPEQHLFGGYNTWAARSAGLEVTAEPKIAEAAIELLEEVSGRPRREWKITDGPTARSILELKPFAYWRLNEITGPEAVDASGNGRTAIYESAVTYYLEGPHSAKFCRDGETNRAPHFAGGGLRSRLALAGDAYSVSMWIWNGMPNEGRNVSGWLYSKGPDHGIARKSEHVGIGGKSADTGRLIYMSGSNPASVSAGKNTVPRWEWNHVALIRQGQTVRIFLNGVLEIETSSDNSPEFATGPMFFGGRCDNDSNWEGRLDEIAVFDRAFSPADVAKLAGK